MKRLILICWLMLSLQGCIWSAVNVVSVIAQDYGTPSEDPQNEKDKNK